MPSQFSLTRRLLTLGTLALACAPAAWAADPVFPNRPIKLIAPFAAGGAIDVLARTLADSLRLELGQPVVVENRAGAGGTIGVGTVATAPGDGYTILLGGNGSMVFAEGAYKLNYSVLKDLRPIGMVGSAPAAVVVRTSLGVNSLQELVQRAKKTPALTYGSPGIGSASHLAGVLFEQLTGTDMIHVPYKGLAPALTDIQAGNVDLAIGNVTTVAPFIQSGRLKALAITDTRESQQLPGVPTSAAAGMPNLLMSTWYGVMTPATTPDAVARRLEQALAAAMKREAFVKTLQSQGFDQVSDSSAASLGRIIKRDYDQWVPLIRKMNIQMQ